MPDLGFMNQNEQEAVCVCAKTPDKYTPASFLQHGYKHWQKAKHSEKLHTAKTSKKGRDKWLA